MEKLFDLLVAQGGVIELVVFIVPGFVAWRTYQWRRPQGQQKAADAIVDIFVYSVATALIWFAVHWIQWPDTLVDAARFALQVFITPIMMALLYERAIDFCARRLWITSPHPRAWDFIFNSLTLRKDGLGSDGMFLVVTLKNGDKVAGVFTDPGIASLWPYDRDILLGQSWKVVEGRPSQLVEGSIGVYIDASSIDTIEILDYPTVVQLNESRRREALDAG